MKKSGTVKMILLLLKKHTIPNIKLILLKINTQKNFKNAKNKLNIFNYNMIKKN